MLCQCKYVYNIKYQLIKKIVDMIVKVVIIKVNKIHFLFYLIKQTRDIR